MSDEARKRLRELVDTSRLTNEVTPLEDIRALLDSEARLKAEVERLADKLAVVGEERTRYYKQAEAVEAKVRELEDQIAKERACHDCREYRAMMEAELAAEQQRLVSEAVAEERKALRRVVLLVPGGVFRASNARKQVIAALDARERAK